MNKMVATYHDKVRKIAYNTFEITCYMFPLEECEIHEEEDLPEHSKATFVSFDGAARGGILIKVSPDLLNAIAANMLGVDEASDELKEGALNEIANIICGNTVPLFAKNEEICVIGQPQIVDTARNSGSEYETMQTESTFLYLDEGIAEITIHYSNNGKV